MTPAWITLTIALLLGPSSGRAARPDVTGAWALNHELSTLLPERPPGGGPDGVGRAGGPPPGGGMRGRGGFGGLGGHGGGPSDKVMHTMTVVRRRLTDAPERLVITRSADSVTITDGDGRRTTLRTDGKKQDRLTGDGEFKSKTHFEGPRLIVEDDFDGTKVTRVYDSEAR